ncbi:MAG TPA: HNH endonuclease, partial [Acidimicrobiales bacterium]
GTLGPGQLELGPVVPDPVARYLSCDARVQVLTRRVGQLAGINPAERTPNRATRRYLARRDQGCTHPLCSQRRWLHAHHIVHWRDGGMTVPSNLVMVCPYHHRALHLGEIAIDGDPEAGTLRFLDRFGRVIEPPGLDPPSDTGPRGPDPPPYTPPTGERLQPGSFTWN